MAKRGRPKGLIHTEPVMLRLKPEQKRSLEEQADAEGVSVAVFARQIVSEYLDARHSGCRPFGGDRMMTMV